MKASELIHQLHPLLFRRNGDLIIDDEGGAELCTQWMSGKSGRELYDLLRECLIIVQGLETLNRSEAAVSDMQRLFIEPIGDAMLAHARGTLAAEQHRKNDSKSNPPMQGAFKAKAAGVGLRKR